MKDLDLINAANNSISGIYYVVQGSIPTGPACMVNGFIGQLSVQVRISLHIDHGEQH